MSAPNSGTNVDAARAGIFNRKALNLPNAITMIRFVMALGLFTLIYLEGFWKSATTLFVIAASTDFLDGYLARKYNQVTILGRILDPFVDKIIICGSFIFLIGHSESGVTAWMAIVVVGREMFVSTLRGLLEQKGLDFSANWVGKIKMAAQCVAVAGALVYLALPPLLRSASNVILARDSLLWGVVALTAYSGLSYVLRASQLLKESARNPGTEG